MTSSTYYTTANTTTTNDWFVGGYGYSPMYGSYVAYGNKEPIKLRKCDHCSHDISIFHSLTNRILYNLDLTSRLCFSCAKKAKLCLDVESRPIGFSIDKVYYKFEDLKGWDVKDKGILVTLKEAIPDELILDTWKAFNEALLRD